MRTSIVLTALAAGMLVLSGAGGPSHVAAQVADEASRVDLPFERDTLPNGLTVILSEDRSTPMVAVDVWYHVGSKNEEPGRTGFAHLFEHVMFTGSGHVPYGVHDRYTEGVGGGANGSTNNDRTNYFETVPSNYLEAALWLESDRMGWLLDALDLDKLNAQRDIVKNERRQGIDNRPYGRAGELISAALYPEDHSYRWPVIGSMEDLSAASADDVKSFFRLYYAPNNATVAIVGDFDPVQAMAWVAKYFGEIPRGQPLARPDVGPVSLSAEKRLVYEDRVQVPRLYLTWPTVGVSHPDKPGAAQSVFAIGHPGPSRGTPDYYAIEVMNTILGGLFQSRPNHDIREVKGYSYGVGSGFAYGKGPGAFQAGGSIVTAKTDSALVAFLSHLRGVQGDVPFTADEMSQGKAALIQRLPQMFASVNATASAISGLYLQDLPLDYYQTLADHVNAVTNDDLVRVARRYIDLDHLEIVIVGDRSVIEASLTATNIAPIVHLDIEGEPLAAATGEEPASREARVR